MNCNHFSNEIQVNLRKASSLVKHSCLRDIKQHLMRLKDYLRNFNCWHRENMKAEDLGAIVTHNKALQFLLVDREVASFDIEVTPSRKAKHILTLGIPGHTISIGFLMSRTSQDYNWCNHSFAKKHVSFSRSVWPITAWCAHAHRLFTFAIS